MDRDEVAELHFITSIQNLGSILAKGILSHKRAARLEHRSVASAEVQGRRQTKRVPGGSLLHSYASLYFHARNPMMNRLLYDGHTDLIVLRVSSDVLDMPDAIVTDGNAAADSTLFYPSPEGLQYLDSGLIFAKYWTDLIDGQFWPNKEKKRVRNAEVLVPNLISSAHIKGCYVDSQEKRDRCQYFDELPAVAVRKEIYFR